MDKLEELTEYLGRAYGEDLWSDFAIDGARELIDQLGKVFVATETESELSLLRL